MSISKFGRISKTVNQPTRGPKCEGYNLTPEGDYVIGNKRLANIGDENANQDSVNRNTP